MGPVSGRGLFYGLLAERAPGDSRWELRSRNQIRRCLATLRAAMHVWTGDVDTDTTTTPHTRHRRRSVRREAGPEQRHKQTENMLLSAGRDEAWKRGRGKGVGQVGTPPTPTQGAAGVRLRPPPVETSIRTSAAQTGGFPERSSRHPLYPRSRNHLSSAGSGHAMVAAILPSYLKGTVRALHPVRPRQTDCMLTSHVQQEAPCRRPCTAYIHISPYVTMTSPSPTLRTRRLTIPAGVHLDAL